MFLSLLTMDLVSDEHKLLHFTAFVKPFLGCIACVSCMRSGVVFLSNVYVLVTLVSPAKTFEPIEMLSGPYLCGPGLDRGHIDTTWRIRWILLCIGSNAVCHCHYRSNLLWVQNRSIKNLPILFSQNFDRPKAAKFVL